MNKSWIQQLIDAILALFGHKPPPPPPPPPVPPPPPGPPPPPVPPPPPPPVQKPMTSQTKWMDVGTLSPLRAEEIMTGYPIGEDADGVYAGAKGRALPIAQSWMESRYGQDDSAQAKHNPLGLMAADGRTLLTFPTWGAAFGEWSRRMDDPGYKGGVYPRDATLEQFIVTYVGGPRCWSTRGADCANGETWESAHHYLDETVARLNRYFGTTPPLPPLRYTTAFIPAGNRNRPGTPINTGGPHYVTVHETANTSPGADAEMHRRFVWDGGGAESVSFHLTVDDHQAIQLLPFTEIGWHAGDGCDNRQQDLGCFDSIAIETCVNSDGNWERTLTNLVTLIVKLIRENPSLSVDRIRQHNAWSGKDCPKQIRAQERWGEIITRVKQGLAS